MGYINIIIPFSVFILERGKEISEIETIFFICNII